MGTGEELTVDRVADNSSPRFGLFGARDGRNQKAK